MLAFFALTLRQAWLEILVAPQIRHEARNPRSHRQPGNLGPILARDGTPLAYSEGGRRIYPFGAGLAQTVGYASERYGTSGLEATYAKELAVETIMESPLDRLREVIERRSFALPTRGGRVVTTLDPVIQSALVAALAGQTRAAGVVLDPHTGDVLAAASVPSFSPDVVDSNFPTLAHDPQSSLLNRVFDGLYPPGSTFKIVTAATGIQTQIVTPDSEFHDPGYLDIGNYRVHNDQGEITGDQTLRGAFMLSSNVDFAHLGLEIGVPQFLAGVRSFGVGVTPPPFPLEIAQDRVENETGMTNETLAQYAFGQADLLVTPLRMALIAAAIAADGTQPQPRLVSEIRDNAGAVEHFAPRSSGHPVTSETAQMVAQLMIDVVNRGTGTAAQIPGYAVAGKTGTATNPHGAPHSWFVAFAPAQSPRFAIAVIVENGGYGGAVAAPIVRRVLTTALTASERTK